jgi:hypothetical protein
MEQAEIERVRRVLRQRSKPRWRVLWRGRPYWLTDILLARPLTFS